jgi:glycosyltransferase involved in cell wall biosynthesis
MNFLKISLFFSWPYKQIFRSLKLAKLIAQIFDLGGGFVPTFRKIANVFWFEGLTGLKGRFKYLRTNGAHRPIHGSDGFDRNDYQEWIRRYDTLKDSHHAVMKAQLDLMDNRPLISIVMPTYNSNIDWLRQAIDSVRAQIYPNWELCIADDASTKAKVSLHKFLREVALEDHRIKVKLRDKNGHISAASNTALTLSQGEWVALLDHDDILTEDALFFVAKTILENPRAALIYSDEDKIDVNNVRSGPYFKPDWNYELFLSHNLITHLGIYRKDIIDKIGGFRLGYEGAQDYDLALRFIDCVEPSQIVHIPKVLYHWRVHDKSTAKKANAKPYAMIAGERAINDRFKRLKIDAKAEYINFGYKVSYALPTPRPLVSIIIPTRNGLDLIRQCISSILEKTDYDNYEIIVIDNNSDDLAALNYFNEIQSHSNIRVIKDDRPFNYSELNNSAVDQARGDYVVLLNNDIEVMSRNWLAEMLSYGIQPGVGAVGARLWYPNNTAQHAGVVIGIAGWAGHAHRGFAKCAGYVGRMALVSNFSAVTGACLLISKKLYQQLGGLNAKDLKVACNDVDFCLRLVQKGYRNVFTPNANLYHHESATRGHEDSPEKQARFAAEVAYMKKKYANFFDHDPAYNRNLTMHAEDFSLSWPPRDLLLEKFN